MSYIYENMPSELLEGAGYFETKRGFAPIVNGVNFVEGEHEITPMTQILYYPGAFGVFHEGHVSVIEAAIRHYTELGRKVLAVIAPCNAEYSVKKYGNMSPLASNKLRYDSIKESMPDGCVIDLNPMLNFVEDQNFTDLLLDFVERNGFTMHDFVYNPVIISGKDRESWKYISDHSDEVSIFYAPDITGASTSGLKKKYPDIEKKACILRCHSVEEYKLFLEYFGDQYYNTVARIIEQERILAFECSLENNDGIAVVTICKDYADILPYYKVSRAWKNPFEQSGFEGEGIEFLKNASKLIVIDSDTFSGTTKNKIVSLGHKFVDLLSVDPNYTEIVDIDDFRKDDFCYPYVDISYRCSMQAFDTEMHDKFSEFKNKLKEIK